MNFWHPVKGRGDLTISNLGRGWITPAWITPCNFTLLPEDLQSDPQYTLLFYRGLVNDYNDDKFPLASNDVYDYDGNIIAALALRLDTDYGVYNKLLRNFIDFVLNSPGDYTFFKKMSVAEIATLNLFKWHNAFETDWLIKEIRFNIKYDTISTAQIIASTKIDKKKAEITLKQAKREKSCRHIQCNHQYCRRNRSFLSKRNRIFYDYWSCRCTANCRHRFHSAPSNRRVRTRRIY